MGLQWFEILESLRQKNLLNELKNEITRNNYTLIGNYVGLKIIKYSQKIIVFHGIVENYSKESCIPILNYSSFFEKFGLNYSQIEKVSENIDSFISFAMLLKQLYQDVSESHIAKEEEGSVGFN
jgi:hypothetical protein